GEHVHAGLAPHRRRARRVRDQGDLAEALAAAEAAQDLMSILDAPDDLDLAVGDDVEPVPAIAPAHDDLAGLEVPATDTDRSFRLQLDDVGRQDEIEDRKSVV